MRANSLSEIPEAPLAELDNDEITVAIASLSIGGAERIVLDWASRIYPRWRAHLIVLRTRVEEWPVPAFVRVTRLEHSDRLERFREHGSQHNRRLAQLREIGREMGRRSNPTVVCHLLGKDERDALAQGGASIVTVLHNARNGWPEEASCLSGSALIVAVSEACAKDLRASGWTGPVSIIRHIPPRKQFSDEARKLFRKQWSVPETATVIGMIGAIKPQKDYCRALRVFKALHQQRDAYLVILGGPLSGPTGKNYWQSVVAEVERLGLRKRVAMPGFIPYAAACLPAFDIVLNTSRFEGLSIATLEALTGGKPVVASKVGGQGEIGSEGLTLMDTEATDDDWASALSRSLDTSFQVPDWVGFPSYRLWTLVGLARPFMPSKKVLFVTANLNSGGAQRSLVNLSLKLKGTIPFAIAVAGPSTASYYYRQLREADVEVVRSSNGFDAFDNAEVIVNKICEENIGTVCFWNLDPKVKLLVMKTLGASPVRFIDVSPGDNSFSELSDNSRFAALIAYPVDVFYTRLDSLVLKYHGVPPAPCAGKTPVIPNGIPEPERTKTDYSLHGAPRVAVNGRIAPTKFLMEIIAAMRLVREQFQDAELHVFGDAEPLQQKYADCVRALAREEIGTTTFFHGPIFNAVDRLPDFDAYVVLGYDQGCPNALLEALAVGMPSIGNDSGGTREQIIDGTTGLLIPDTSPIPLAHAIVKILSDRRLAERLGQQGRAHVLESFGMERMARAYRALLADVPFTEYTTEFCRERQSILEHAT